MASRIFASKAIFAAALITAAWMQSACAQQPTPPLETPTHDPDAPRRVGGAVLPPTLIKSVEPKYPHNDLSRPANGQTVVVVALVVDRKGHPTNIHIDRSGGDAFDKNAMEAVSRYLFKPATLNGQPVSVTIDIVVRFQISKS